MRASIVLTFALLVLSIAAFEADAAPLTSKNSVVTQFPFAEVVEAKSPDCATPGVAVIPLPSDTLSAKVTSPKVGSTMQGARVTAVDAAAPGFSITFNAEPEACDPVVNGDEPGAAVPWNVLFTATGTYDRRVTACLRPYFDSFTSKKCKVRPRKVFTGVEGIERGFRQYYYGIRWKSFGGSRASGKGKIKQECGSNGRCPPARRVKIVADKSRFCGATKSVEYMRLTSYSGGKLWFRQRIAC